MAVVSNTISGTAGELALDTRKELEHMRSEIERYRTVFDSARLIVGHELNKPLTSISGYVELLESRLQEFAGDKERRYFLKIKEAISELEKLVEAYVQMLRIDWQGRQTEDLDEVDLGEMVGGFSEKYSGYPAVVENAIDPDFPILLLKRNCVEIVIDNLISNALKHGDGTSPVVVGARIQRDRRGMSRRSLLIVTVEDRGEGIPEEKISEIFNPFFRADTEKSADGLGLGLTLVRNVMDIMMGDISVASTPGRGTTVTVSIPILGEPEDPHERVG